MMKILARMALALAVGFGAAAWGGEIHYTTSTSGVGISSAWSGATNVNVTAGTNAVHVGVSSGTATPTGSLNITASGSRNAGMTFNGVDTAISATFGGNANLTGTSGGSAELHVTNISGDDTGGNTFVTVNGTTTMGTNSLLTVSGDKVVFTSQGGLVLNDTFSTGATAYDIVVTEDGVLQVGGTGMTIDHGKVNVTGGSILTSTLTLGIEGDTTPGNVFHIGDGGEFTSVGLVTIYNGEFNVGEIVTVDGKDEVKEAGDVMLGGGAVVDGMNASMNLRSDVSVGVGTNISLKNGGALNVLADSEVTDNPDGGFGSAWIINESGSLYIEEGATLTVDNIVSSSGANYASDARIDGNVSTRNFYVLGGMTMIGTPPDETTPASATVDAEYFRVTGGHTFINGKVSVSDDDDDSLAIFDMRGGTVNVQKDGTLTTEGLAISGGLVDVRVDGEVSADATTVSGGALNVQAGGKATTTTLGVYGDGEVNIDGSLVAAGLTASGNAVVNFNRGSSIGTFSALSVTSDALVTIATSVAVGSGGSFSFNGGTINVKGSVSLTIGELTNNLGLSGDLVLDGGSASFSNNVTFSGGGVYSQGRMANINMNENTLTFVGSSILDVGSGSLDITNSAGLTINSTYLAGYNNTDVTMVRVSGGGYLRFGQNAQVKLTVELQAKANEYLNSGTGGSILILSTDSEAAGDTEYMNWDSFSYNFTYKLMKDEDGHWGLYITNAEKKDEDTKYDSLINRWKQHPKVGDWATRLITRDFGQAVADGHELRTGPDQKKYEDLTKSGKFNANVLTSFAEYPDSNATFDGLMLYNGSGLGYVNRAIIESNRQVMKKLNNRNAFVRDEVLAAGETFGSGSALASEYMNDNLINRLWVSGFLSDDKSDPSEGFPGYKYRPRGLVFGYDRSLGDMTLGGAFSFAGGEFQDRAALGNNSTIDTYGFHAYGGYNHPSGLFLSGSMSYGYSENSIHDIRVLNGVTGTNRADYHSRSWMLGLTAGFDWRPAEFITVTPSVGVNYLYTRNAAHSQYFSANNPKTMDERNTAGNTLNATAVRDHSTTMPLDLAVSYDIMGDECSLMSISANVGYAYEFHNSTPGGYVAYGGLNDIGPVKIIGRQPGRHFLNIGAGFKYTFKQFEFDANYDYVGRSKFTSHMFSGTFGWYF